MRQVSTPIDVCYMKSPDSLGILHADEEDVVSQRLEEINESSNDSSVRNDVAFYLSISETEVASRTVRLEFTQQ